MPAGAIGAASSIGGAILGNNAAGQATAAAKAAQKANNQVATSVYNTNTGNLQPFVNTGQSATGALGNLLGLNGAAGTAAQTGAFNDYLNSTNYNFQLQQGENAVKTANAPALESGATAKALNNYAQGQAGSALQGYEGLLTGLGSQGVGAASNLGTLGTQYAAQTASNNNNAAGIQIGADYYNANNLNNAFNGIAGAATTSIPAISGAFSGLGSSSFPPINVSAYMPPDLARLT
jgi:hypothetical protein